MLKRVFLFFLKLIVILVAVTALFITAVNYNVFGHIYTQEELTDYKNETASVVLSGNGTIIGKYFTENRTNIEFDQIPEHLINALIATEDARYFEHQGVDTRSLFRVLFKSVLLNDKRSGGGSTITQQLAKNMYGRSDYGPITMLVNKTKEAIQAHRIEQTFTKNEILTLYLNTVSFGENIYGIESAALRYFNSTVEQLNIQQSAVLVGILKANTYYNPRLHPDHALERRNVILEQMVKYEYLTQEEADAISKSPLALNYTNLELEQGYGYFLSVVKKEAKAIINELNASSEKAYNLEKDGLRITTTLDHTMQQAALKAFQSHLSVMQPLLRKHYQQGNRKKSLSAFVNKRLKQLDLFHQKTEKRKQELFGWKGNHIDSITIADSIRHAVTQLHAGLLALHPKSGAVKTWIGGINHQYFPYDQIHAQRQLASTFKPLVYAAALEQGHAPCNYISNTPITMTDHDNWTPSNADHTVDGNYSMAGALMHSKNIPTVNLFLETGFNAVDSLWNNMEFSSKLENIPSLPLGIANASIYELARAYTAFANNGEMSTPYTIATISTADGKILYTKARDENKKVMNKITTQFISSMLQRAVNEGTGTSIRSRYNVKIPLAGKTGTSQNYADAWFTAYNPNLVMVSRVGANSPKIHFHNANGAGGRLALPLVGGTLNNLGRNTKAIRPYNKSFKQPDEITLALLDCEDYKEETLLENFFDLFKKKNKSYTEEQLKQERKKEPFFKRLFKKKKRKEKDSLE